MRSQAVLVVEDEAAVALELGLLLQSLGYRVLGPAFTVQAALKMIEAEQPDAALLDVNVAGELVTSVATALKARNVPFGLVTASADVLEPELRSAPVVLKPILDGDEIGRLLEAVLPPN